MKALVLVGKNEDLAFQEVEKPQNTDPKDSSGKGSVVVKVKAAALNHRDVWIQKGMYAGIKYPTILGSDGAGETEDGTAVIINPSINWGENPRFQSKKYEILGLPTDGTFAEYIKVPAENIVPKPEHLTFEQAAALPLAGLTAYRALFTRCQIKAGEKVLISGIGGGVALFALQFALAAGCDVWVTSSSGEKIARAVSMGAKGGYNYRTEGWSKTALAETGGFDCVIDSAAGTGFADLIKACAAGARVCFYGGTNGAISGLSPQIVFYKQISIFGSTMGSTQEFNDMVAFVEAHKIVPVVDEVFTLENGNAAMKKMDEGKQFGKLVLSI
ncbi:MAG: zinc-binding dehydrogenase [Saprospiraceae bacterium]|nr:zinc-binding dehydrogenase [Saprospiraceae bacterium]